MSFHAARFEARESADGCLLLLDQQDRTRWDNALIREGLRWLTQAARGDELSTYHLEAAIASEHCLASAFAATNWPRILELYDLLVSLRPTAIHRLNRAIALAYVHGPQAGIAALSQIDPSEVPKTYYFLDAVLGELHRRAGNPHAARRHFERALQQALLPPEQELLRSRLASTYQPSDD
jgi:RNA polymerase sigma-70 factor (ECF subfamily)